MIMDEDSRVSCMGRVGLQTKSAEFVYLNEQSDSDPGLNAMAIKGRILSIARCYSSRKNWATKSLRLQGRPTTDRDHYLSGAKYYFDENRYVRRAPNR